MMKRQFKEQERQEQPVVEAEAVETKVEAPAETPAEEPYKERDGIVSGTAMVNVRSTPKVVPDNIVSIINEGTGLKIFGEEGEWYQIRLINGKTGYMMKKFVK